LLPFIYNFPYAFECHGSARASHGAKFSAGSPPLERLSSGFLN
jgi:hypothetical protein